MDNQSFDDIVAGFYRAAQGSCGWLEALRPFQESMAAFAIHLHAFDLAQQRVVYSYSVARVPPEAELDYVRTYHRIDPRANLAIDMAPGAWFNCWDRFDDDFVARSPFYQEFLIPYGGRHVSGTKLIHEGNQVTVLGVHRGLGDPRLSVDEQQVCQRLARHLTDALRFQQGRMANAHRRMLGSELLARLRAPVVLIDEERRLLHVNPAARSQLASGAVLTQSDGHLFCRRPADDNALVKGLRELLRAPGTTLRDGNDKLFVRASSPDGKTMMGLYLYALRPEETLHVFGEQSLAMLIIHQVGASLDLDPFVIAAAFCLTPGEARVAAAAAQGASPDELARAHGVSTNTVRSQLSTIFLKTGTNRQAQLVSVLSALPLAALGLD